MALDKQFSRKLDQLWQRRTTELRALVVPRRGGKPLGFSRNVRERLVNELLDLASVILVRRQARSEFREVVRGRKLRFLRGRGLLARGDGMIAWASAHLSGPVVYSFWKGKRCLYVGKGKTWRRLIGYQKSAYLLQANSIEVFQVKGRSQLPKAECLATHLFVPRDRKVRPSRVKWGKACPICRKHDRIREELTGLFRMR